MRIRVNDTEVEIFEGAKVQDVLRKYSLSEYQEVAKGSKIVVNGSRSQLFLKGELSGQEELKIINKEGDSYEST